MPYITKDKRVKYETTLMFIANNIVKSDNQSGELNYVITKLLHLIIIAIGEKYSHYNMLMGALNCITHEFYSRKVSPYEDKCILKNGDI